MPSGVNMVPSHVPVWPLLGSPHLASFIDIRCPSQGASRAIVAFFLTPCAQGAAAVPWLQGRIHRTLWSLGIYRRRFAPPALNVAACEFSSCDRDSRAMLFPPALPIYMKRSPSISQARDNSQGARCIAYDRLVLSPDGRPPDSSILVSDDAFTRRICECMHQTTLTNPQFPQHDHHAEVTLAPAMAR